MVKIIIVGAGITGMAIASQLPKHHDVTILARDLPGDPDSSDWASPWAGASWLGMEDSPPREQRMQLDAFAHWWKLAATNPESSVKRIEMHDLTDFKRPEDVWYFKKMPGFRVMARNELPEDAPHGMSYQSIILTPHTFLPWLRARLEASGVTFTRAHIRSLADLRGAGADIVINATGWGSRFLGDVADQAVEQVHGQTAVVRTPYDKLWIRRGKDYTYVLPRGDGTAVLGGIKQFGNTDASVDSELRKDIFRRVHEGLPKAFPENASDFKLVRDLVGIRPERNAGVRVEKEIKDGQNIIHAYGAQGGGYVYSWGLARDVVELVNEIELEMPKAKL